MLSLSKYKEPKSLPNSDLLNCLSIRITGQHKTLMLHEEKAAKSYMSHSPHRPKKGYLISKVQNK